MKTKGFTLVELLVACTLLLLLSTVSYTTTYNFIDATANLKAQHNGLRNIMFLHDYLVNAKLNLQTDLQQELSLEQSGNPNGTSFPAETAIQTWNNAAANSDSRALTGLLISPVFNGLPSLPLDNPGGSYLPTSTPGEVITFNNGSPSDVIQITDITSLLRAFYLTHNNTPTGTPVATISMGTILDPPIKANGFTTTRPMLPKIDWKSGTPQEIQY